MDRAIEISHENVEQKLGGPFGAVVIFGSEIIAEGANSVVRLRDPTAHAEIMAIKSACEKVGSHSLAGHVLFSSCEPCPMCYAAARWANIKQIYYVNTREDAHAIGFSDREIYREIQCKEMLMERLNEEEIRDKALMAFKKWTRALDIPRY